MKLVSAVIKNYRLHKETKVDFDESRTIIGGSNETGKSTLMEAIHNVLFLKAKGNKHEHRVMVSDLFSGDAEVELVFSVSDNRCVLTKRFGKNGATKISIDGKGTFHDANAEEKLYEILGDSAVANEWAHLWIRQGESGADPSGIANKERKDLLQQLQNLGAAAIMQSKLDGQLAYEFSERVHEYFTSTDRVKKDSELGRSEAALLELKNTLEESKERLDKLESAASDLEAANDETPRIDEIIKQLKVDKTELVQREAELLSLRELEKEQQTANTISEEGMSDLLETNKKIIKFKNDILDTELVLKPGIQELKVLEEDVTSLKGSCAKAKEQYDSAYQNQQLLRDFLDLAGATRQQYRNEDNLAGLRAKYKEAKKLQEQISSLNKELSGILVVNKTDLNCLQKLEGQAREYKAVVQAMAAGLEIIKSNQAISAGGKKLSKGEKLILLEDTEIQIGNDILIHVTPGGGTSLEEARNNETGAQRKFDEALNKLGVKSVEQASEIMTQRETIEKKLTVLVAKQEGMDAVQLEKDIELTQNELTAIASRLDNIKSRISDSPKFTKVTIREIELNYQQDYENAEHESKLSQKLRDKELVRLEELTNTITEKTIAIENEKRKLADLKAKYSLLIETHGDDEHRAKEISKVQATLDRTLLDLKQTLAKIDNLQPDLLALDKKRIDRTLEKNLEWKNQLNDNKLVAITLLKSDGRIDPKEAYTIAKQKQEQAIVHHKHLVRQAEAIKLLDNLFSEEQQNLSEQYTRPLAEKTANYLKCIYGSGTEVYVTLEDGEFKGFSLQRTDFKGKTFPFDSLSGGTKEQVAAAVRLAMAEVLAEASDGKLPLVFDDAFANTDPDRIVKLQRMLDLAADRGLQIIVLTCTPAEYSNLGAKQIILDSFY